MEQGPSKFFHEACHEITSSTYRHIVTTLIDLNFLGSSFDVRFWRDGDATRWEVLKGDKRRFGERPYNSRTQLHTEPPVPP